MLSLATFGIRLTRSAMAVEPPLDPWDITPYIEDVGGEKVATFKAFEPIFRNILSIAMIAGAVVCFAMLVVGGFKLMTGGGDPKKIQSATGTITYAILGLVLFIGAWFIMKFIKEFTGVDLTLFEIPS